MVFAWLLSGLVLAYYCHKVLRTPGKLNWNKAIVSTLFWPLSILSNWLAEKEDQHQ